KELDAQVTMFSYPNGGAERYMTPEIARLVREAGFEAATTSWNGFATAKSDVYALERVLAAEALEDLVFALEVERFLFKPAPRQQTGTSTAVQIRRADVLTIGDSRGNPRAVLAK